METKRSRGRPTRTSIDQFVDDSRVRKEELNKAMDDKKK